MTAHECVNQIRALSATRSFFLNTSRDGDSSNLPGQFIPKSKHPFREEIVLPNVQPKSPLVQCKTMFSRPVAGCLGGEADPHLATPSFQGIAQSDNVTLQDFKVLLRKFRG